MKKRMLYGTMPVSKRREKTRKTLLKAAVLALSALVLYGCFSYTPPPPKWPGIVYHGENEPLLEGTTWYVYYTGGNKGVMFLPDGKIATHDRDWSGTWQRVGNSVNMVTWEGRYYYEGTLYPQEKRIVGTRYNSDNGNGYEYIFDPHGSIVIQHSPSYSSGGSTAPTPQSTLKTYTVTVYYERNGARLPHFAVVQASSPMEATMLGRIEWENSALGQYKYLSASVSGGF